MAHRLQDAVQRPAQCRKNGRRAQGRQHAPYDDRARPCTVDQQCGGLRQNGKPHPHRQCRQKRNTQHRFHGALQFLRIPGLECPCHARQRADPERLRYAWHEQKEGQRHIVAAEKVVRHGFRRGEIPFGDRAGVHGKQRCGVCLHGIGDTRLQK